MIDILAAAAEPLGGYERQIFGPEFYTLVVVVGWVLLHGLLPLIGGVMYATHWRTLLTWVAALAIASFAIHAGHELWSVASYDDYRAVSGALSQTAIFVFVPAFGAAAIGIFVRKLWDHSITNKAKVGVHE